MATVLRGLVTHSSGWSLSPESARRTTEARIRAALAELGRTFPFDDYLFDLEPHGFLARLISNRLLPGGGRILDLGGGACDKAAVFVKLGFECEVWDDLRDPWHRQGNNLQAIMDFARRSGVPLHVRKIRDCAFREGTFDLVMINDVIEHLHESPRHMLNVAIHSLREGGILLVITPNAANLRKRLSVLCGRTNHPCAAEFFASAGPWRGHVREWTRAEMVRLLGWMGLVEVRTRNFHGLLGQRVASPTLRVLYRMLAAPFPWGWDTISAWGKKPAGWTQVQPPKRSPPLFPLRSSIR